MTLPMDEEDLERCERTIESVRFTMSLDKASYEGALIVALCDLTERLIADNRALRRPFA